MMVLLEIGIVQLFVKFQSMVLLLVTVYLHLYCQLSTNGAVMKFPYPGALTALQYFTSAAGVFLCGWLKLVEHDKLDLMTMWRFLPAAVIFYLSLFTNSELLLHANVDTFIVFRSAVPIFVAVGGVGVFAPSVAVFEDMGFVGYDFRGECAICCDGLSVYVRGLYVGRWRIWLV
ncbi:hypothetical protein RYX36_011944 [Vicia faba]